MQTGLKAGLSSSLISMVLAVWSMFLLASLYLERKRDLVHSVNFEPLLHAECDICQSLCGLAEHRA